MALYTNLYIVIIIIIIIAIIKSNWV